MAMFPLGSPLLPGSVLPLQVFEPRYRQMVTDLLRDTSGPLEFGVVLIERGREVGGGDQRALIATTAEVADVRALPGDRYALVAVGSQRLRVNAWLPDDPYPIADVDRWPDEPDDLAADAARRAVERLHVRVRALNDRVRALGELAPPPDAEISDEPSLGLYHLGALAPLGAADRQRMLAAPGLAARLELFEAMLDDAEAVVSFRGG